MVSSQGDKERSCVAAAKVPASEDTERAGVRDTERDTERAGVRGKEEGLDRRRANGSGTEGPNTWQTRYLKSASSRSERELEIVGGVICSERGDVSRGRP